VNDLVARYRQLAKDHLVPMIMTPAGRDGLFLKMRTHRSEVVIAQAAVIRVVVNGKTCELTASEHCAVELT
jgi:hypothetical protein